MPKNPDSSRFFVTTRDKSFSCMIEIKYQYQQRERSLPWRVGYNVSLGNWRESHLYSDKLSSFRIFPSKVRLL